jgi:hypothetical protein
MHFTSAKVVSELVNIAFIGKNSELYGSDHTI